MQPRRLGRSRCTTPTRAQRRARGARVAKRARPGVAAHMRCIALRCVAWHNTHSGAQLPTVVLWKAVTRSRRLHRLAFFLLTKKFSWRLAARARAFPDETPLPETAIFSVVGDIRTFAERPCESWSRRTPRRARRAVKAARCFLIAPYKSAARIEQRTLCKVN